MLDWIKNGMREDYHGIVDDTATALYGCIDNAIHNFAAKNKNCRCAYRIKTYQNRHNDKKLNISGVL